MSAGLLPNFNEKRDTFRKSTLAHLPNAGVAFVRSVSVHEAIRLHPTPLWFAYWLPRRL